MEQSFIAYIENSIKNNWDLDALTEGLAAARRELFSTLS